MLALGVSTLGQEIVRLAVIRLGRDLVQFLNGPFHQLGGWDLVLNEVVFQWEWLRKILGLVLGNIGIAVLGPVL